MSTELGPFLGYCPRCKESRSFKGIITTSDSGRNVAEGSCPVCSSTMRRILGKQDAVAAS